MGMGMGMGMGVSFQYPMGMGMGTGMGVVSENGYGCRYSSIRLESVPLSFLIGND